MQADVVELRPSFEAAYQKDGPSPMLGWCGQHLNCQCALLDMEHARSLGPLVKS